MEYHKIPTVWKRDPDTKYKRLIEGAWSTKEIEYLADCEWLFTEKVDGTNIRVYPNRDPEYRFAGRTDRAVLDPRLRFNLHTIYFRAEIMERANAMFDGKEVCLYGEGFGGHIQNGRRYAQDERFVLFDVNVDGWWLSYENVVAVGRKLELFVVPLVGRGTLHEMISHVRQRHNGSEWGAFQAEGIVARPPIALFDNAGKRIITKVKEKDFH